MAKGVRSRAKAEPEIRYAKSWQCPACTNWNYPGDDVCRWCGEIPGDAGPYASSETLHPLMMTFLMLGTPLLPGVTAMLVMPFPKFMTVLNAVLFVYELSQFRYNVLVSREEVWKRFKLIRRQIYVLWCAGCTGFALLECLQYWLK